MFTLRASGNSSTFREHLLPWERTKSLKLDHQIFKLPHFLYLKLHKVTFHFIWLFPHVYQFVEVDKRKLTFWEVLCCWRSPFTFLSHTFSVNWSCVPRAVSSSYLRIVTTRGLPPYPFKGRMDANIFRILLQLHKSLPLWNTRPNCFAWTLPQTSSWFTSSLTIWFSSAPAIRRRRGNRLGHLPGAAHIPSASQGPGKGRT